MYGARCVTFPALVLLLPAEEQPPCVAADLSPPLSSLAPPHFPRFTRTRFYNHAHARCPRLKKQSRLL